MLLMSIDQAVRTLKRGGTLPELGEAIGVVMTDARANRTSAYALVEGLKYPGFVAEQAKMALYRRLGLPLPDDRGQMESRPEVWRERLDEQIGLSGGDPAVARAPVRTIESAMSQTELRS